MSGTFLKIETTRAAHKKNTLPFFLGGSIQFWHSVFFVLAKILGVVVESGSDWYIISK
jgi:hypothetical protein